MEMEKGEIWGGKGEKKVYFFTSCIGDRSKVKNRGIVLPRISPVYFV